MKNVSFVLNLYTFLSYVEHQWRYFVYNTKKKQKKQVHQYNITPKSENEKPNSCFKWQVNLGI